MPVEKTVFLVGCSAEKLAGKHPAEALYSSERFILARELVKASDVDWAILSGRHGLIAPSRLTAAYDFDLRKAPTAAQAEWSAGVTETIRRKYRRKTRFVVIADESYYAGWLAEVSALGHTVFIPSLRCAKSGVSAWLRFSRPTDVKRKMLEAVYACLSPLVTNAETFLSFQACKGGSLWPTAGVYLFFDTEQTRLFEASQPKVIRVGTHGVSDGSISTLWQRLKAHKGDLNGLGNHRTSIFRLHVGTALIRRGKLSCPSWGSVERPSAKELKSEADVERLVSDYIGRLHLCFLPITDPASKRSDRAYVEQNLIAIMSGPPGPVECAAEGWLGFDCTHRAVQSSSLWNVNHTEESFDPGFLKVLEHYVEVARGRRAAGVESLAPANWYESSQHGFTQGFLF
ncbi:MAG TPA: hypothetical protein VHD76_08570 [Bryobacteraceae bacterium]|nr:hypothetical protein [Bryobacteraceae bacterium]